MKALAADDPRVIGEYRLRAQLGAGGMGRVYLGLSPAGRAVAIKVVHPDLASDAEFLRRFGQEVAAARAVSGIYTAPVVASGLNERPPWLATAFVPGPSLDQVVGEHGPLPEQALWPLLAGLVEALQAIHACGVVHRDLKPANVLLAADGPRVIDFGISRAADGTALTAAGVVFGTPGFMSPEQAEGRGAGPRERRVRARVRGRLRGGGRGSVRHRHGGRHLVPRGALRAGPGRDTAAAAGDDRRVPGQGPGRPPHAAGAFRRDLQRPGRDRAVRGGVLAVLGGRPDRRLSGQARAGNARRQQAGRSRGVFLGFQVHVRAPADHAVGPREQPAAAAARRTGTGVAPAGPTRPPQAGSFAGGFGAHRPIRRSQGRIAAGASGSARRCLGLRAILSRRDTAAGRRRSRHMPRRVATCRQRRACQPRTAAQRRVSAEWRPAGYPPPYQMGSRGPIAPLPASMATAVRLMYAGAAYALVWTIGVIVVWASIVKHHPVITARAITAWPGW